MSLSNVATADDRDGEARPGIRRRDSDLHASEQKLAEIDKLVKNRDRSSASAHYLGWRDEHKWSVSAMANGLGGSILPQIQRIFQSGTLTGTTDGQLLERFAASHDEASFEALLARYGPLVLSVCRNLLRDRDDVDDAFQATFFVLVRKAGSIRLQGSLGPWIYAVAYRVANRARANRRLRTSREITVAEWDPAAPAQDLDRADVSPLLHDELARLPERLRAPIVLCYFQGLTHEVAAQQLRWPVGTVRSRMARGRDLLRSRLVRKGVVPSAGFLVAASRQTSAASLRRALSQETTQAALRIAAGRTIEAALSSRAALLMEGVLNAMWLTKLKTTAGAAIAAGLIVTGVVAIAAQPPSDKPAPPVSIQSPLARNDAAAPHPTSIVLHKTYFVGDLIAGLSDGLTRVDRNRPRMAEYEALVELLTTSIAPGTWNINGHFDPEVMTRLGSDGPRQIDDHNQRIGVISPLTPIVSLLIRHTAEVHNEITVRLRQLRALISHRDDVHAKSHHSERATESTDASVLDPPLARDSDQALKLIENLKRDANDLVLDHGREKFERIQQNLEALEREVNNLALERDRVRPTQPREQQPNPRGANSAAEQER